MPRTSRRQKVVRGLKKVTKERAGLRLHRSLGALDDSSVDESLEALLDDLVLSSLAQVQQSRCLVRRGKHRKSKKAKATFEEDLHFLCEEEGAADNNVPFLNEKEFKQRHCVSKKSFKAILDLIKDHEVFKTKRRFGQPGKKQAPVEHQLAVFLKFLGVEGSGASNESLRAVCDHGGGTSEKFRERVLAAIRSLRETVITWPDEAERKIVADRMNEEFGWPNCVGTMDGTLFPLAFAPQTEDAPDHQGRKGGHTVASLIICDDQRRVRHHLCGWPGSTHDCRMWRNCKIFKEFNDFFSLTQCLLTDSAFECSRFCIPAFKKPIGAFLDDELEFFNTRLSKCRIVSEHCIGMLKGRFPFLKSLRFLIKDDGREGIRTICTCVEAAVILHNLLIEADDEGLTEWTDDGDNATVMDEADGMSADELAELELRMPLAEDADKGERREQLVRHQNGNFVCGEDHNTTSL